jgi:hypothetical protein
MLQKIHLPFFFTWLVILEALDLVTDFATDEALSSSFTLLGCNKSLFIDGNFFK